MDKKITQRIIGIFVIIALAIIVLPLFFSKNETPKETASSVTTPPPFVDKATEAAQSTEQSTSQITENTTAEPTPVATGSAPEPLKQNTEATNSVAPSVEPSQPDNQSIEVKSSDAVLSDALKQEPETIKPEPTKVSHKEKIAHSFHANAKKTKSMSGQFHKTAWVVQMGSFKNKDNARRLTDRLRVAGFKAFTRAVTVSGNERVHVYVGPELKQASAAKLSSRINQQIKMKGMVVKYNPLAL